jgi:hypothetical protein
VPMGERGEGFDGFGQDHQQQAVLAAQAGASIDGTLT